MKKKYLESCLVILSSIFVFSCTSTSSGIRKDGVNLPFTDIRAKEITYPDSDELFQFRKYSNIEIRTNKMFDEITVPKSVKYRYASREIIENIIERVKKYINSDNDVNILFESFIMCGPYITELFSKNKFYQKFTQNNRILKPLQINNQDVIIKESLLIRSPAF